jgi:hypothetical protein
MFRLPSAELHPSVDSNGELIKTNTRCTGCSVRCPQRTGWKEKWHETNHPLKAKL